MATPLEIIKQGIESLNWEQVAKAYKRISGESVKVPKNAEKSIKVKTVVRKENILDKEAEKIIKFYSDKNNYTVNENGIVPIMVDSGDTARKYKIPEKPQKQKVNKKTPKNKIDSQDLLEEKNPDDDDYSYLRGKTLRREYNDSRDLIETNCIKCNRKFKVRKFEAEVITDYRDGYTCPGCVGGMK